MVGDGVLFLVSEYEIEFFDGGMFDMFVLQYVESLIYGVILDVKMFEYVFSVNVMCFVFDNVDDIILILQL